MKLIKVKDYSELSKKACSIVLKEIQRKPNLVIGFATGKTPLGFYGGLVERYKKGGIDFSRVKSFNLDEYYPIKKSNKKSFCYYMFKNLFDKINIKRGNINLFDGETKSPKKECMRYEALIRRNPIDIQILGVGVNGHIGFDEPGSLKESTTRLVELSNSTKKINKTSKKALTMGIKTIIKSKKIILLADGKEKREAISHLIKGNVDKKWPVSFLKKHRNLIVIADKSALG